MTTTTIPLNAVHQHAPKAHLFPDHQSEFN